MNSARFTRATSSHLRLGGAVQRRLVRRILASGCLMLFITATLAIATVFMFHPIGFAVLVAIAYSALIANSVLQADSFAPVTRAPVGPLQEVLRTVKRFAIHFGEQAENWLASTHAATPSCLVQAARARQTRRVSHLNQDGVAFMRSISRVMAPPQALIRADEEGSMPDRGSLARDGAIMNRVIEGALASSEQGGGTAPGDNACIIGDQLKPWQRKGVSIRFLQAFVKVHNITRDMTTTDVMEMFIKPETAAWKCCYIELLTGDVSNPAPSQWLGKASHFVSHW